MVQKGKFADCAFAFDKQLNKVDFPTFGKPTIPHFKAILRIFCEQRYKESRLSEPRKVLDFNSTNDSRGFWLFLWQNSLMKHLLSVCILSLSTVLFGQDSLMIRSIYDEALLRGESYENLRQLCKNIGPRLSGSSEAQMAVEWSQAKMNTYGFDRVYLQEIKVPHWERGTKESAWFRTSDGQLTKVHLLALGGSIGTNGTMEGEVIEFKTIDELKKAKPSKIKGKIVFLNQAMDATQIQTFKAYGACYAIRGNGAVEAGKLGAKAVIIGDPAKAKSEHLMRKFGRFVENLGGKYVTAEDVGTTTKDMEYIKMETNHVVGLPEIMGGGGDPSPVTAYGVYMGIKASAKKAWGNDNLGGKKIAVQGAGKVGLHLIELLHKDGAHITVTDIFESGLKNSPPCRFLIFNF